MTYKPTRDKCINAERMSKDVALRWVVLLPAPMGWRRGGGMLSVLYQKTWDDAVSVLFA